jgi:threonine synthase
MNVGHPSNLPRIVALYNGTMDEKGNIIKPPDLAVMRKDFFPVSVSDSETRETIKETWMRFKIILEPHGAVAWKGLTSYLGNLQGSMKEKLLSVSLETAHPAKFGEEINRVLDFSPSIPDSLLRTESKNEEYLSLGNNYNDFKKFLIKNY